MVLSLLIWHSAARAAEPISIEDAWVRDAPPHAEMSAAYLTIVNRSAQAQTLAAISSPQFRKVEVHRTEVINGQVHMQREDTVTVAAHARLAFAPGGYHLMLIHPLHELTIGDSVELRLQFKGAAPLTVQARIREAAEESRPHDMHDMHDMNM